MPNTLSMINSNQGFGQDKVGSFYRQGKHQISLVGKEVFIKAYDSTERDTERKCRQTDNIGQNRKAGKQIHKNIGVLFPEGCHKGTHHNQGDNCQDNHGDRGSGEEAFPLLLYQFL